MDQSSPRIHAKGLCRHPHLQPAGLLRLTAESLASQRLPPDEFEVIVSDDGSTDQTAALAHSFQSRLHLKYCFQEDQGFRAATARNAGARLAAGPLLLSWTPAWWPAPISCTTISTCTRRTRPRAEPVLG